MTAGPEEDDRHRNRRLDEAVRRRRERRELWKRVGERSIGQNLAMIGALGWVIVTPTLIGVFVGRWLDRIFGSGLFWTLGLLVVGLAVGSTLAWTRMHQE
ncbi:AtpZ/AtpI family protein [Chelativorans xinjiangense]|uniref:AtpZ/AtpI family protein n=1 Tax=Chelativorans xinjiangense TaxID=2681485 RepID=UPI00135C854C|nr:AtpZ/AtpI family protein [Chelativorans xinjiangense]